MKKVVIIPAAGTGSRVGAKIPKQYIKSAGKEIIAHTLFRFNSCRDIDEIVLAAMPEHFVRLAAIIRKYGLRKAVMIAEGGKTRHDSVFNALRLLKCRNDDIVLVHDSVRPFVSDGLIRRTIENAVRFRAAVPVMPVNDTVKKITKGGFIAETADRSELATAQTPQGFRYGLLMKSFEKAREDGFKGTDESSVAEHAGYRVRSFPGEPGNIKITLKEDIKKLKHI